MPPTKITIERRSSKIRQRKTGQSHTLDVSNIPNRTVTTEELEHVENISTNTVLNSVRELSTTVKQLQAQINSVTNTLNTITQGTSTDHQFGTYRYITTNIY
jgi:adenylosuccinate synthase